MSTLTTTRRQRSEASRPEIDLAQEMEYGFAHKFIRHKTRQLVGRAGLTRSDREELDQELKLRLIERFPQFDPQKADWKSFVTTVIERQVATMLQARSRLKRSGAETIVSLSEESSDDEGLATELADQVTLEHAQAVSREFDRSLHEHAEVEHDLAVVLSQLPPEERHVCELLQQVSLSEAARQLNVPRTTLYATVARLRERFAAHGLRDFL